MNLVAYSKPISYVKAHTTALLKQITYHFILW
jgi:hypothetical protein